MCTEKKVLWGHGEKEVTSKQAEGRAQKQLTSQPLELWSNALPLCKSLFYGTLLQQSWHTCSPAT